MMFGPGDAGKSTVVRSTRIAFSSKNFDEFIRTEASEVKRLVKKNIVESVLVLHEQAKKLYPKEYYNLIEQMGEHKFTKRPLMNLILKGALDVNISPMKADIILSFWNSDLIQKVWNEHRSEFYIHDNTAEFISRCKEIIGDDYKPTQGDFLKYRQETHELEEFTLEMLTGKKKEKKKIKILDCGGQTNHQEVYKSKQVFRDYANQSTVLFVVIPVGDLETEERTGCVTQGFQILCSLLKTSNQAVVVDDEKSCFGFKWTSRNNTSFINLNRQAIVVFLNKKDVLDKAIEKSGHEKLVNNWFKAAIANLDSSDQPQEEVSMLRKAICESKDANPLNAALFFFNIVQRLAKTRERMSIAAGGQFESAAAVVASHSTATDTNDCYIMKWIMETSLEAFTCSMVDDLGFYYGEKKEDGVSHYDSKSVELVLEIYEGLKKSVCDTEERARLFDIIKEEIHKNYLTPVKVDVKAVYEEAAAYAAAYAATYGPTHETTKQAADGATITQAHGEAFKAAFNPSRSRKSQKVNEAMRRLNGGDKIDKDISWLAGVVDNWLQKPRTSSLCSCLETFEPPTEEEFYLLYTRRFPDVLRRRYSNKPLNPDELRRRCLNKPLNISAASSDETLPPGDSGSGKGSTQPDEGPSNFSVFNPMSIKI